MQPLTISAGSAMSPWSTTSWYQAAKSRLREVMGDSAIWGFSFQGTTPAGSVSRGFGNVAHALKSVRHIGWRSLPGCPTRRLLLFLLLQSRVVVLNEFANLVRHRQKLLPLFAI